MDSQELAGKDQEAEGGVIAVIHWRGEKEIN